MSSLVNLDRILRQAVESKAMPGVVAVAATDTEVLYEGAFGKRDLGKPAPMTLDSVVWIASMTKAITATAAMQLVERGKLSLERPASEMVPELAAAKVLEGFDAAGKPRLRAPKRPITLRHLLTHTAGFGYEVWDPAIARYQTATGTPGITTCTNAAFTTPLMFDPGDRWEHRISIHWACQKVEVMSTNHIGALEVGEFRSAIPALSNDIELLPGISLKWGLSFLINAQQLPTGRSAGSLAWAGLANTYFWIDRTRRVSGVFLSQVFPFYDHTTIDLLGKFETEVYRAL